MLSRVVLIGLALSSFAASGATPVLETFSPRSGTPGTTVTISGTGFGTDAQVSQVTVGADAVPIASINDTTITFNVTSATPSGTITVTIDGVRVTSLLPFLNLRTVTGALQLPAGMTAAGYRVGRGLRATPAADDGSFSAAVPRDAPQIITAWRGGDDPLFMAIAWPDSSTVTVNARSTAIALAFSSPLVSLYNGPHTEDVRQRLALAPETTEVAAVITAASADGLSYLDDARFQTAFEALLLEAARPTGSSSLAHPELDPAPAPGVRAFSIIKNTVTPVRLKPALRTLPGKPKSWAVEMGADENHPNLLHETLLFHRVDPSSFGSGIHSIENMDSGQVVTVSGIRPLGRGFVGASLRSETLDLANLFGKAMEKLLDTAAASGRELSNSGFLVPKEEPGIYEVRAYSGNLAYGISGILGPNADQTIALGNLDRDNDWRDAMITNLVIAAVDVASLWLGEVEAFQESDICGIILSVKAEVTKAVAAHVGARGDFDTATLWDIVKASAVGIAKAVGPNLVEPTFDELFITNFFKSIGKALKLVIDATGKVSTVLQVVERTGNLVIPTHFALERTMIVVGDPFAPSIDTFFPGRGRAGTTVILYGRGLPSSMTDLRVALCTFAATGSPPTVTASLNCTVLGGNSQGISIQLPDADAIAATFGSGDRELYFSIENVAANSTRTTRFNRSPFATFSYLGPPTIVGVTPATIALGEGFAVQATGLTGKKDANVVGKFQGNTLWPTGRDGDKLTFSMPGYATPGTGPLTLEVRDPTTLEVRSTSAPFAITVSNPRGGNVGSSGGGLSIRISKWDMSNAPDGHISIFEAFSLAGGTLGRGLEQHPTPEDTERREVDWVSGTGSGGANTRDSIGIEFGLPVTTPLVLNVPFPKLGNGDYVQFGGIFDGSNLPEGTAAIDLVGLERVEFRGAEFRNFPGPGIRLGAGSKYNAVLGGLIDGCDGDGVLLEDGAQGNYIFAVTIEDVSGDGIRLTGANTTGNLFASASAPPLFGGEIGAMRVRRAGGVGVRIIGGASDNVVDTWEVRDCIGHGIEVTGTGTLRNAVGWVAGLQSIRHVAGNGGDGVRIGDGASGTLTWYLNPSGNAGDGYNVFGPNTHDVTLRGPWAGLDVATDPEKLRARRNGGYSIALRDVQRCVIGAPDRAVLGDDSCIGGSDLGGILLDNADDCELRGLYVGIFNNLFGAIDGNTWLPVGTGNAIHLRNGSSGNLLGDPVSDDALFIRGAPTGSGVLFEGIGTDNNVLVGSNLGQLSSAPGVNPTEELMYGVSIIDGASNNVIGAPGVRVSFGGGTFFQPYNQFPYATAAAVRIENVAADIDAGGEPVNPNQIVANSFGVTGFGSSSLQPYVGVLLKGATRGQWIGGPNPGMGNQMGRVGFAGIHLDNVTAGTFEERNRFGGNWISSAIAPAGLTNTDPLAGPVRSHSMVISGGTNQVVGEGWIANNQFFGGEVGIFVDGGTGHRISSARVDNHPIAGIVLRNASNCQIGGFELSDRLQLTRNGGGGGTHASAVLITGGSFNQVSGCWIGDEGAGDPFWANAGDGVRIVDSHHNIIGGAHPDQKNFFTRCGRDGVHIRGALSHDNELGNNLIGLNTLNVATGNTGNGVRITAGASSNRIGGDQWQTLAANPVLVRAGNTITASGGDGVLVDSTGGDAVSNRILGNSIYANAGRGIALAGNGNHGQPRPQSIVMTAAEISGSVVLASTPAGSLVEVFAENDLLQPEGETRLTPSAIVQSDGSWSMLRPFLPGGGILTFTVTNFATGDTSEFTTGTDIDVHDGFTFRVDKTPGAAPAADVWPGGAATPVLGVTVATDNVDVVISSLELALGGTAELASLRFAVYHDTNRNGLIGPGDRRLCPETTPTTTDLSLTLEDAGLLPDESQRWLVVARALGTAPTGRTLNLNITAAVDVPTRLVLPVGAPIVPQGSFPLLSEAFTIGSGSRPDVLITSHPVTVTTTAGGAVVLSVAAQGSNLTYQWLRNGLPIPGATGATYTVPAAQFFHEGMYSVIVSNGQGSQTSTAIAVNVDPAAPSNARLLNLSTRALALTGDDIPIPGFVLAGQGTKRILIRAVGPTLVPMGVNGELVDPQLRLVQNGSVLAQNDDWSIQLGGTNASEIAATAATVGAFSLPAGSKDAALLLDLPPGPYTVPTSGVNGLSGITLVELYDADAQGATGTTRLVNLSNRGFVGTGDEVMIPGFVISNEGSKTLLIRVVGPTLGAAPFNVPGTMADPRLRLYRKESDNTDTLLLEQDNWSESPGAATTALVADVVGAFALLEGSADSAFVITLAPGVYTAVGSSADGASVGVVLVEVYVVE